MTKEKYASHIKLLNRQYNLLFEFLANYYEYGNLKHENSNSFILSYSLFSVPDRMMDICRLIPDIY